MLTNITSNLILNFNACNLKLFQSSNIYCSLLYTCIFYFVLQIFTADMADIMLYAYTKKNRRI